MALVTYPLNNIQYSAEDAELFHCTRTSGVFAADEDFSASVSGADNTVNIGQGIAWIRNSRFSGKVVANKSSVDIDMGLADGTYPRIDAIVIRFDANKNETEIVKKEGSAASSPVAPEVVRTEALYELHVYHVRRRAGATSILASDITDLRTNEAYCGVMADEVTAISDEYVKTESVGAASGVAPLNSSKAVAITNGGTAATNSENACANLSARYLGAPTTLPTATNFNSLTQPGVYRVNKSMTANAPHGQTNTFGVIIVEVWSFGISGGIIKQTHRRSSGGDPDYQFAEDVRFCIDGTWTKWTDGDRFVISKA